MISRRESAFRALALRTPMWRGGSLRLSVDAGREWACGQPQEHAHGERALFGM
jgi:hypothetical protein